ncbi:unnamed protein product [Lampetra planeri]
MGSEQSKGQAKSTSNQPRKAYSLNCAICEGIFYDPVFLPCGHTFCRICFDVHWELERTRKKCPCPQWTCNLRWEWKPKLRTDEELRAQAERARENLVSSKLCGDGSAWRANEREPSLDRTRASISLQLHLYHMENTPVHLWKSSEQKMAPTPSHTNLPGPDHYHEACRKLVETFPEWRTRRIEVLKMLFKMIVQLRKRKRDGKISKATGASAGIVGGAMVIAGLALAPLTFGASLGLTIAGTATGVAGSITAAGSSIAVLVMNKASTKEARANVENDKIAGARFAEVVCWVYSVATERDVVTMDTLVSESVSVKGGTEAPSGTAETAKVTVGGKMAGGTVDIVKSSTALVKVGAAGYSNTGNNVALAVAKGVAKGGMRITGFAVAAVFLGVNILNLISATISAHRNNPSQIEEHWQEKYSDLKLHLIGMAKINDYFERNRN